MSWFEHDELPCPSCGARFLGATAETINVTRMPEMRDRILDGTFNRVVCPHCKTTAHVDRAFLYSDMTRKQFVHVFPRTRASDWPVWEETALEVFRHAFDGLPGEMRDFGAGFGVRAVFGGPALADKLHLADAGLEDAIVELLKLELHTSQPELRTRQDLFLDVVGVDAAAGLIEVAATGGAAPPAIYGVRLSRYEELMSRREELVEKYLGLFSRPFVGYRRLAREPLAKELLAGIAFSETPATDGS